MKERLNTGKLSIDKSNTINKRLGKKVLGFSIAAGSLGLVGVGMHNLFSSTNFRDYKSLYEFTSPSHQIDRCNTEKAFDAQEKMYKYFHTDGRNGISNSEANAIAPTVGLDGKEVQDIIDHELFYINYSCNTPTGSTQTATIGIVEGTAGISVLAGAGIAAGGLVLINRRRQQNQ